MDALAVVAAAMPGATEADADYVLWNRTPFPMRAVGVRELYHAARRLRRAGANGRRLCDLCDRQVMTGKWLCAQCALALT